MSERRENIIQEFSAFRVPVNRGNYTAYTCQPDPRLQRTMTCLVDRANRGDRDAWARCFLVAALRKDLKFLASLGISNPPETDLPAGLQLISQRLTELAPAPNRDVRAIYADWLEAQSDREVASFLNSLDAETKQLLSAYLQKISWYAANKFYRQRIELSSLRSRYPKEECFQIASEGASEPVRLLQKFDFRRSNTIKTYADKRFFGIVSDRIRKENLVAKTNSFTDYGLLRTVSKKELKEALQFAGKRDRLSAFCLAWQCYKDIHHPTQEKQGSLQEPDQTEWQQMSDRYNQLRQQLGIAESTTWQSLKTMVLDAAQALKDYRSQSPDAGTSEFQEALNYTDTDPLDKLSQEELFDSLKVAVEEVYSGIDWCDRVALELWLGLEFSQQEILQLLGEKLSELGVKKQFQLSRRLNGCIRKSSKALIEKLRSIHPELLSNADKNSKTADATIVAVREVLKEYLSESLKAAFCAILQEQVDQFTPQDRALLQYCHRQELDEEAIAQQLNISAAEISPHLNVLQQRLQDCVKNCVKNRVTDTAPGIDVDTCNSADRVFANFVEKWLAYEATFQTQFT